jgi:hypothetical protein
MNDEFMNQLREAPRAEFAGALYERISQQPHVAPNMATKLTFRNSAIVVALLFFIAACVYAVVERRWNKVGDIWVHVERTYKVQFVPLSEVSKEPGIQFEEPQCVTLQEGREILRFDFRIPTWAPDGLRFQDRICGIDRISDYASIHWEGADQDTGVNFWIRNQRGYNFGTQKYEVFEATIFQPVAPVSYKEVMIHGKSAVLVQGSWDLPGVVIEVPPGRKVDENGQVEAKWDKNRGIQLHWLDGEVMYSLYAGTNVSTEDLIKTAESAE